MFIKEFLIFFTLFHVKPLFRHIFSSVDSVFHVKHSIFACMILYVSRETFFLMFTWTFRVLRETKNPRETVMFHVEHSIRGAFS